MVSFKLETDEAILVDKALAAFLRYKYKLIIGNVLETRKYHVVFVKAGDKPYDLTLSEEEMKNGIEIEKKIVDRLSSMHEEFIKQ